MKENQYDDSHFFEQYSHFPRSAEGLSAAGEWHALKALLPDFRGKRVLDLGCGFGWHCRYAAEQGAAQVLGIDLSEKMLSQAEVRNSHPVITYRRAAIEDLDLPEGSFDVVLSSLALHYVEDLDQVCRMVYRLLTPGGVFVLSCEHPVFTARGDQEWYRDGEGNILHWPVDRYFDEGARTAHFLGCDVTKYHRTLTSDVGALLKAGFVLTDLVEPRPDPRLMDVPGMADELRRPMMLILSGRKPEGPA